MKGATRAARMKNDYEGDAGARVVTAPANIGLSVQFGRPHTAAMFPEPGSLRPGTTGNNFGGI
jgi:hypothetical protein